MSEEVKEIAIDLASEKPPTADSWQIQQDKEINFFTVKVLAVVLLFSLIGFAILTVLGHEKNSLYFVNFATGIAGYLGGILSNKK